MLLNNFREMFRNTQLSYPGRTEWSDGTSISSHADVFADYSGEGPSYTLLSCSIQAYATVPRGYKDTGAGEKKGWYLCIGTGNTPEDPTDIHLDEIINLNPISATYIDGTDNILKKVIARFTNNTADDIVVKEIGLGFGGSTWYRGIYFLAARKVLDVPITLHAGETYQFSYAISQKVGG